MADVKSGRLYWYTSFQPVPYDGSRLLVCIMNDISGISGMYLGKVLAEEAYPPKWDRGIVGGTFSFDHERLEALTPEEATFYILGGDA